MRKPYSAPNYDDPTEWLTPPEYYHAPLREGEHSVPIAANALIVTFTVNADPNCWTITMIVRTGGA